MNPADALVLLLAIVLGTTVIAALTAAVAVLFPNVVERTRHVADVSQRRSFVVGLVNAVFLSALVIALSALAERVPFFFVVPALLTMIALGVGVVFGVTSVTRLAGGRMWPDRPLWQQTALGATTLTLACLVPIFGWFGLLPFVISLGLGAFILGLLARRSATI